MTFEFREIKPSSNVECSDTEGSFRVEIDFSIFGLSPEGLIERERGFFGGDNEGDRRTLERVWDKPSKNP